MSDAPADLSSTPEDRPRTPIAAWVTLIIVLLELVCAVAVCANLLDQTRRQVADLGMELPKATEVCLKLGTPVLLVIGVAAGATIVTLNCMISDGRLRVLVNLIAMTGIVGSCLTYYQILLFPFRVGPVDLSGEPQLPTQRVLARCV